MAEQGKDEKPTQRRLNKAREDGNYPSAKEFVSALRFMIFRKRMASHLAAFTR